MTTVAPLRTRTDLRWFALLTLLLSWLPLAVTIVAGRQGDVWFLVGTSGPTLAALLLWLAGRRRPPGPVRPVLARAWVWLPAAVVVGALPSVAAAVLAPALGGPAFDPALPARLLGQVGGLAPAIVMTFLAGPLAEELGWRGYAQPRLRRFLGPVTTSVVLGLGWAAWHLPLFLVDGTSQAETGLFTPGGALFVLTFVPMSYLFLVVTERLRGGVVAAVVLHAAFNAGLTFSGVGSTAGWAVVFGTVTVAALVAAAANGCGIRTVDANACRIRAARPGQSAATSAPSCAQRVWNAPSASVRW